jgi:ketosteroid isomerase-like protein
MLPHSNERIAMSDEAEIQAMLDDWAAAVRAHDLDAVLRHRSADIVMSDVPEPLQCKGVDAYRDTWTL